MNRGRIKNRVVWAVVALLLFSGVLRAADWIALKGPEGGRITGIVVPQESPATAFVATGAGVFKTTDSGANWSLSGLPGEEIGSIAIVPLQPGVVYASSLHSGLWKSTNSGSTWNLVNAGLRSPSLVGHPAQPDTLLAGPGPFLKRSTDGGTTWEEVTLSAPLRQAGTATVTFSPVPPYDAYAVSGGWGGQDLYRSTDGGVNWSVIWAGYRFTGPVATDTVEPHTVYRANIPGLAPVYTQTSTDGGLTWSNSSSQLGTNNYWIHNLCPVPNLARVLYASTQGGIFKSTDGGSTWFPASSGLPASGFGSGSFNEISQSGFSLAVTPGDTAVYAGAAGQGAFKSTDGGQQWQQNNRGLTALPVQAVASVNDRVLYVGTRYGGVYRSEDGGAHWSARYEGLDSLWSRDVRCLAADPSNPAVLYAGTTRTSYKSTNGGDTWDLKAPYPYRTTSHLVLDPRDPRTVYAGTSTGLVKSTDAGETWANVPGVWGAISSLGISPAAPYDLFVSEGGSSGGALFRSWDGGASWVRANPFWNHVVVIDPSTTKTIYTGSESAVHKSTDGGQTWTTSTIGPPGVNFAVSSLVIDPVQTQSVYAGSYGNGIFSSTDGGVTWAPLDSGLLSPWVNTLAGSTAGHVYAGTNNGVFRLAGGMTLNTRFKLSVRWQTPEGASGWGHPVAVTPDSGYFYFFEPQNLELMVKILDGRGVNGSFWVFYGALTDLKYDLTIIDTQTGAIKMYSNPQGTQAGRVDVAAFQDAAEASSIAEIGDQPVSLIIGEALARRRAKPLAAIEQAAGILLNHDRFQVEVGWTTPGGSSGTGTGVGLTSDSGYFWFFGPDNIELVVKVIDGRGANGRFWVFYGALTDLHYTLKITDKQTGAVRLYEGQPGVPTSGYDLEAF